MLIQIKQEYPISLESSRRNENQLETKQLHSVELGKVERRRMEVEKQGRIKKLEKRDSYIICRFLCVYKHLSCAPRSRVNLLKTHAIRWKILFPFSRSLLSRLGLDSRNMRARCGN